MESKTWTFQFALDGFRCEKCQKTLIGHDRFTTLDTGLLQQPCIANGAGYLLARYFRKPPMGGFVVTVCKQVAVSACFGFDAHTCV